MTGQAWTVRVTLVEDRLWQPVAALTSKTLKTYCVTEEVSLVGVYILVLAATNMPPKYQFPPFPLAKATLSGVTGLVKQMLPLTTLVTALDGKGLRTRKTWV